MNLLNKDSIMQVALCLWSTNEATISFDI